MWLGEDYTFIYINNVFSLLLLIVKIMMVMVMMMMMMLLLLMMMMTMPDKTIGYWAIHNILYKYSLSSLG